MDAVDQPPTQPVTIDLGNITEYADIGPPHPRRRPATAAGIAAALLLACLPNPPTAPTTPHPTDIALAARPTTILIADDLALAAEPDASGTTITASGANGGQQRWTTHTAAAIDGMQPGPSGLLLLSQSSPTGPQVSALSTQTGHTTWQVHGEALGLVAADRLIITDRGAETVVGLQPRTGHIEWTHTANVDTQILTTTTSAAGQQETTLIVLVDQSGLATVLDGRTGRQLTRASVAPPAETGLSIQAATVANQLIVSTPAVSRPGTVLAAYDLPDLHPRWQTSHVNGGLLVQPCTSGPVPLVCINGGQPLRVVDALTGELRWTSPYWSWGQPHAAGQLQVFQADTSVIIDLATGRTLCDLTGWSSILTVTGLLFHTDVNNPNRTWYGSPDSNDGGVHPLGYLDDASQSCTGDQQRLACVTAGLHLTVVRPTTAR